MKNFFQTVDKIRQRFERHYAILNCAAAQNLAVEGGVRYVYT